LGVGNNEDSFPSVWRPNARSWNKKRPDFVPLTFQVSAHRVENQSARPMNKARNVFSDDPSRPSASNNAEHFRPQIAVVSDAPPLSGVAERLAWEPAGENIDNWGEPVEFFDFFKTSGIWEMVFQYGPAKRVTFDMVHVAPSDAFRGQVKTSDAGKQRSVAHHRPQ
tara:strand:- start:51 stop:548 length:498 start_codon:yes stop_codon:yes gene_type:complete